LSCAFAPTSVVARCESWLFGLFDIVFNFACDLETHCRYTESTRRLFQESIHSPDRATRERGCPLPLFTRHRVL